MNFFVQLLNISILPIDGTTTLGQSRPGINSDEKVLHTPQIFRTGASPSDTVRYHTKDIPFQGDNTKDTPFQGRHA